MASIDPKQLIGMLKNGNPQQVAEQLIQTNFQNDPLINSMYQMATSGNFKGVENFARQYLGQKGKDFNTEMSAFIELLNSVK